MKPYYKVSTRFCAVCDEFTVHKYNKKIFHSCCLNCGGHTILQDALPLMKLKIDKLKNTIKQLNHKLAQEKKKKVENFLISCAKI